MKIQFNLRFSTRFGQSLSVTGNIKALGNYDITNAFRLTYVNNHLWSGEVEVDPAETVKIHYQYIFFREDGTSVLEWDDRKQIDISKTGVDEIRLIDSWCDASSVENTFYTDPFQEVLLAGNRTNGKGKSAKVFTHIFKVKSPLLQKNEILSVTGDSVPLGDWDPRASVPMTCEEGWWTTKINLPDNDSAIAYKFLVYDSKAKIPSLSYLLYNFQSL